MGKSALASKLLKPAGVVHRDTLFLVGNLQSPDPEERPVLPTVIVMCQYHFPTQKWTRLKPRAAPEICHYPLLAAYDDQLILFGGKPCYVFEAATKPAMPQHRQQKVFAGLATS